MNRCWERSSRARAVMIFDHARVNPVRQVQSISAKHLSMPVSHPQKRGGAQSRLYKSKLCRDIAIALAKFPVPSSSLTTRQEIKIIDKQRHYDTDLTIVTYVVPWL